MIAADLSGADFKRCSDAMPLQSTRVHQTPQFLNSITHRYISDASTLLSLFNE